MIPDLFLEVFKFFDGEELVEYRTVCKQWNSIIENADKILPMFVLKDVIYIESCGTVRIKLRDHTKGRQIPFKKFCLLFTNQNLALSVIGLEVSRYSLNALAFVFQCRKTPLLAKQVQINFFDALLAPLPLWPEVFKKFVLTTNIFVNRLRNCGFIETADYVDDLFQIPNVKVSVFMDFYDRFLVHDTIIRTNIILDLCVGRGDTSTNFSYWRRNVKKEICEINQNRDILTIFQIDKHLVHFADELCKRFMFIEDPNKFFKKIRLIHIQPATVLIYRSIFILTGTIKSALGANPKMYEISREDGWKLGMEVNEGEEYMGVHRGYKVSVIFHIYK